VYDWVQTAFAIFFHAVRVAKSFRRPFQDAALPLHWKWQEPAEYVIRTVAPSGEKQAGISLSLVRAGAKREFEGPLEATCEVPDWK
jgi:hypothetical protein